MPDSSEPEISISLHQVRAQQTHEQAHDASDTDQIIAEEDDAPLLPSETEELERLRFDLEKELKDIDSAYESAWFFCSACYG